MRKFKKSVVSLLCALTVFSGFALPGSAADKVLDTFEEYETDLDLSIYWSAYIDTWNYGKVSLGQGEGGSKGVTFEYDFDKTGAGILRAAYEDMSTTGDGISFWAKADTDLVVSLDLAYDNNAYHYSKKLAFSKEGGVHTVSFKDLALTYGVGENNPQYLSHIMITVNRDLNPNAPKQGSFTIDNVKYVNVQEEETPTTAEPPAPPTDAPTTVKPTDNSPEPTDAPDTTQPETPEETQTPTPTSDVGVSAETAAPTAPTGSTGGNGWILPVVIVAVVVLAGGGVGAYFLIRKRKEKDS